MDVDTGHYVKIAVNHEVKSCNQALLIFQVVNLLTTTGTCAPGYGPEGLDTFDTCMYDNLRDVMVCSPCSVAC